MKGLGPVRHFPERLLLCPVQIPPGRWLVCAGLPSPDGSGARPCGKG